MSSWRKKGKNYVAHPRQLSKVPKNIRNRKYMRDYTKRNRERLRAKARSIHQERRKRTITAYGGRCRCCKESRYEFLVLDHINGGGNEHRRQLQNSQAFYRWVEKENYPPILRVLCNNCNASLAYYGYCPHEKEQEQAA